ncbi:PREDICTED: uncharacterized protein At3g43530-like [Camelina sativa]|uniref:Uncharacterized protein At3g43530-like n=1 Tax=Camelina sativa TaxID=90675 RepID=A0ABM1QC55_CAMSA|nr:PREDICTED: uncharacterized protein At3g43530-like [Camelina sativa]
MDTEEDTQPVEPKLYFSDPSVYGNHGKISSRCQIASTLDMLQKLEPSEKEWFKKHKQFRHVWHMARHENNKVMAMWMLLLRTARIEKRKVCWFVVNGVPIRYSMREHALITGFDCHDYELGFNEKEYGNFDFVKRVFGSKNVTVKDVEEKLDSMKDKCNGDRLQVAVLLFLAKIVGDLKAVETFPWGRMTFEDNIKTIYQEMEHCKGKVLDQMLFPGFIIPLEVLAFECIPQLSREYQEVVIGARDGCPLMCKKKLKDSLMKGYPLEEINEKLGTNKDIISILEPLEEQQDLLHRIMEQHEDDDFMDPIADEWNKRLDVEKKEIWWENLYKLDIASRGFGEANVPQVKHLEEQQQENVSAAEHMEEHQQQRNLTSLKELEERLMKAMENGFIEVNQKIDKKIDEFDRRLKNIESLGMNFQYRENIGNAFSAWRDAEAGRTEGE